MYQPAYRAPAGGVSTANLLGQVLGITGIGFAITALAAWLFPHPGGFSTGALILGFILLFAMNAVRENAMALLLFYAFAFLEGIGIAPIISHYLAIDGGSAVYNAAGTTAFGMIVLAGVAFVWSVDWRRFSGIALGALIAVVIAGVISMFTHFLAPTTYSWLILGVFTLLTLIDFSRIRAAAPGTPAVLLAVSIYLDAINIFLALLQLFGGRNSRD